MIFWSAVISWPIAESQRPSQRGKAAVQATIGIEQVKDRRGPQSVALREGYKAGTACPTLCLCAVTFGPLFRKGRADYAATPN